jgi:hypothetical protein
MKSLILLTTILCLSTKCVFAAPLGFQWVYVKGGYCDLKDAKDKLLADVRDSAFKVPMNQVFTERNVDCKINNLQEKGLRQKKECVSWLSTGGVISEFSVRAVYPSGSKGKCIDGQDAFFVTFCNDNRELQKTGNEPTHIFCYGGKPTSKPSFPATKGSSVEQGSGSPH